MVQKRLRADNRRAGFWPEAPELMGFELIFIERSIHLLILWLQSLAHTVFPQAMFLLQTVLLCTVIYSNINSRIFEFFLS